MKGFFEKNIDQMDDKTALHFIHCKVHEILEEHEEGKPFHDELMDVREMIDHLLSHSGARQQGSASHRSGQQGSREDSLHKAPYAMNTRYVARYYDRGTSNNSNTNNR